MSIQQICPVSGECVVFGRGEEQFQQWFQDIRKAGITSIRPIGGVSKNGFVRELKRSGDGYDSYVVLKSNMDRTSDNLYYEWYAGNYLNTLMKRYPLFVKTYGIYEYDNEVDKTLMLVHSDPDVLPHLKETTMRRSIEEPENICIVVQQVHKAETLKDLLELYEQSPTEELRHEILCVLYQVYFVLPLIPGFSHNDLHYENVILTPSNGKYYQYEYTKNGHTFTFSCRNAAKIIDYGRCIYPGTNWIREQLTRLVDDEAQRSAGYPWKHVGYDPCPTSDLWLLKVCMDYKVLPPTFFESMIKKRYDIPEDSECNALVYSQLTSAVRRQFIKKNIPDMHDVVTQLEKLIQPHTYALPRACTIHVSDVADMRVDWPQRAGRTRKRKGGTLTKIREGDILEHMKDIFSEPSMIGQSGTSMVFKGKYSDMFHGWIVMKVQYLGPASYVMGGAMFAISKEKWKQEIDTQIDADTKLLAKYGKSFIPSIVFSMIGNLNTFLLSFGEVDGEFGFTFMETYPDAKSFLDITGVFGDIHGEPPELLRSLIPLALEKEEMLKSVGYQQTDSSYGNFLESNGEVYMIDFGRVVPRGGKRTRRLKRYKS